MMYEIYGNVSAVEATEAALMSMDPTDEPHIVVTADRTVHVPEALRHTAVQFDHRVETVTFDCPRYWDGNDLGEMDVFINYKCADGTLGQHQCTNIRTDGDVLHFDWCIQRYATRVKGTLSFLICIKRYGDDGELLNHWSSKLNQEMEVLEGLECPAEPPIDASDF